MTCTAEQLRQLVKYSQTNSQRIAAAKAGMSIRTARRHMNRKRAPAARKPRDYRTRKDPFENVWHELENLLRVDDGLEAKNLMAWLSERYPGEFEPGQLRTLQRKVRNWRALEGPERKEVFFPQVIQPGRQSQSDYTHCNQLGITIKGEPFPHMLFHFMLPYSRWETAFIAFTESFETLTDGYSKAIQQLGSVAPEHRTDNLAAAVPIGERKIFQRRWCNFLAHYGVQPSANNPGESHENGSVEKSHDLLKNALDQRLRIRGTRDFISIAAYEAFVEETIHARNRSRAAKLYEDLKLLKELPTKHWNEPREMTATVSGWSTIAVMSAVYSVPSRYIGMKLRVHVYRDEVHVLYGNIRVLEMPRVAAGRKSINYRHIIAHLVRKPGAFANYQFREELFPSRVFRQAYDLLALAGKEGDRE